MFRITCYVENKRLADALMGLVGIAVGSPEVTPVVNAVAKKGKVQAVNQNDASPFWQRIGDILVESKVDNVDANAVRKLAKQVGGSPQSYSYYIMMLRKNGFLGKHQGPAKAGWYPVKRPGTPLTSDRIGDNA